MIIMSILLSQKILSTFLNILINDLVLLYIYRQPRLLKALFFLTTPFLSLLFTILIIIVIIVLEIVFLRTILIPTIVIIVLFFLLFSACRSTGNQQLAYTLSIFLMITHFFTIFLLLFLLLPLF